MALIIEEDTGTQVDYPIRHILVSRHILLRGNSNASALFCLCHLTSLPSSATSPILLAFCNPFFSAISVGFKPSLSYSYSLNGERKQYDGF